jgi:hypothetical protein
VRVVLADDLLERVLRERERFDEPVERVAGGFVAVGERPIVERL